MFWANILRYFSLVPELKVVEMAKSDTTYFGYGSNLWLEQMTLRCPDSQYLGVGRLDGYQWIINQRGYANVVASNESDDFVYGLVYSLSSSDEARLDRNEGVPHSYQKDNLNVSFWPSNKHQPVDVTKNSTLERTLVYVDHKKIVPAEPKKEYIYRMNMGINDALHFGIPASFINNVIRKYIPADIVSDNKVKEMATQQAQRFDDGL